MSAFERTIATDIGYLSFIVEWVSNERIISVCVRHCRQDDYDTLFTLLDDSLTTSNPHWEGRGYGAYNEIGHCVHPKRVNWASVLSILMEEMYTKWANDPVFKRTWEECIDRWVLFRQEQGLDPTRVATHAVEDA